MKQQEKSYTTARIREIAKGHQIKCECEKPSLTDALRRAAVKGALTLKSSDTIKKTFTSKVIGEGGGSGYRSSDLDLSPKQIFCEPQEYKDAVKAHESEIAKHEADNKKVLDYADHICDRVELNEFEDGKEAIALMIAYKP